jgi:hypothetical protein
MPCLILSSYIPVTGIKLSDKSQNLAQIEKLANSHILHGSESLCKLLRYLAKQALDHPGTPIKEYQIATELFARQPDFDPQLDSMVRVQAGRLRSKLAEYYASEGAQDSIAVELPKGSYLLGFHPRNGHAKSLGAASQFDSARVTPSNQYVSSRTFFIAIGALSVLLIASLVGLFSVFSRKSSVPSTAVTAEIPPAINIFWHGFQKGPEEPGVIFSNAAFVGRPDLGLRYYDPKRDANAVTFDHYTGVGEVLGVHQLDTVFNELGHKIRVKRGSLFSLDDAKNNDLIFIGSPSENLTLLEIPGSQEFQFRSVPEGARKGNVEIVNTHPQPGEMKEFLATPSDRAETEDYAVIALVRGLDHQRSVLILAGTTTLGTQSAVEFVTGEESLQTLLTKLSVSKPQDLKPFEALLHVKIARGVPVGSELISVHKSTSQ